MLPTMRSTQPIIDVVKVIQMAEQEAFDSLGAKSVVEARQKRRDARRARQVKRWDYVQRRANVAFSGTYRGRATKGELEESVSLGGTSERDTPTTEPTIGQWVGRKLLNWKD